MSVESRYIADVLRQVVATPEDQARLESDLRSHFEEGRSRGEPEASVAARLGSARDVASSVTVIWPSGVTSTIEDVATRQLLELPEP